MPTVKCIYRKKLDMPAGKLAAQVAHAVAGVQRQIGDTFIDKVIVLEARDAKFFNICKEQENGVCYLQVDTGLTVLDPNTITTFAYVEE